MPQYDNMYVWFLFSHSYLTHLHPLSPHSYTSDSRSSSVLLSSSRYTPPHTNLSLLLSAFLHLSLSLSLFFLIIFLPIIYLLFLLSFHPIIPLPQPLSFHPVIHLPIPLSISLSISTPSSLHPSVPPSSSLHPFVPHLLVRPSFSLPLSLSVIAGWVQYAYNCGE